VLAGAVGLHQPHVEIEGALRDRSAVIDGHRGRIACALRMIHHRAQDRRSRAAAERADKRRVIVARVSLPAAVAGRDFRCVVEQMRRPGEHEDLPNIVMTYVMQYRRSRRQIQ
jgi:hypothetical protein